LRLFGACGDLSRGRAASDFYKSCGGRPLPEFMDEVGDLRWGCCLARLVRSVLKVSGERREDRVAPVFQSWGDIVRGPAAQSGADPGDCWSNSLLLEDIGGVGDSGFKRGLAGGVGGWVACACLFGVGVSRDNQGEKARQSG
jgi:hypothetical protein